MASIVSLLWNWWNAQQAVKAKERALIASLAGELRRSVALCEYNAKFRDHPVPAFVRFPTGVALAATFEQRQSSAKLAPLHEDLEHYTMAVSQINQMIELHDRLWASTEQANSTSRGAAGRREHLRHQIADLCSGQEKLEGVGPENWIIVPTFIKVLHKRIKQLR